MYLSVLKRVKSFGGDKKGATMIEYALVVVVVALVAVAGLKVVGVNLNAQFGTIASTISDSSQGSAPSE